MTATEKKGIIFTLIGGILWGASGICGGYIFMNRDITANWLVPYRLFTSGLLMLIYLYFRDKNKIFNIWKDKYDRIKILIFGLIGMILCQYSYYKAIEYSNPGIATVLQYFGPTLVLVYACFVEKRLPKIYEFVALILSISGVFILATHGDINTLQIPLIALLWGMTSAIALVIYTIQPRTLISKYGTSYVIAWGMLIGGAFLSLLVKPWNEVGVYDFTTYLFFMLIVIFGTIISFMLYLEGVSLIGATKASMIACIEPVSATLLSTIFLGTAFSILDGIGFVLVLSTVFIISYFGQSKK